VKPYGLERTPAGTLLVTSSLHEVHEFDLATGTHLRVLVKAANNGGLLNPHGLLVLPDGERLVVANEDGNNLLAYDLATGSPLGVWHNGSFGGKLTGPICLRMGWDGLVYVSRGEHLDFHLTDPHIFSYRPDNGWLTRAYVQREDAQLEEPRGFDFMPGTGFDCNANQRPDACDISLGFSKDKNANGVPDECEASCYADCDASGQLNIDDFICFQTNFVLGEASADCDASGQLNIDDFICFQTLFVLGC